MTFIYTLLGVAIVVALLTWGGVHIMTESSDKVFARIKKEWVKKAARHLQKEGGLSKNASISYAETLYEEYDHSFSKWGVENWIDNPEAVVEEDMTYWEDK